MEIRIIKKKILPILKRQGVTKAAIFGSVARGEANKNSDVDMLVQLAPRKSLLDLIQLKFDLEEKLGNKVDLVSYGGIHYLLRDRILNEQKVIYEKSKRT